MFSFSCFFLNFILKQVSICRSCLGKCSNAVLLWRSRNVCGQRKVTDGESSGRVDSIWIFIFAWTYPLRLQQKTAEGAIFFNKSAGRRSNPEDKYGHMKLGIVQISLSTPSYPASFITSSLDVTFSLYHDPPQPIETLLVISVWLIATTPVTSSAPCLSS